MNMVPVFKNVYGILTIYIVVNDSVKLAMGYSYDRNGSATVIVID